jgi:hypothetical protein
MSLTWLSLKTAISRKDLSAPMRWFSEHRPDFNPGKSILHLGCGKAEHDSNFLRQEAAFYAEYDPVTRPDNTILSVQYDYIFAFYVLNTLPAGKREEFMDMVYRCMKSTETSMAYLVVRPSLGNLKGRPFQSGIITSRDTYQRAYTVEDLRKEMTGGGFYPWWCRKVNGFIIGAMKKC